MSNIHRFFSLSSLALRLIVLTLASVATIHAQVSVADSTDLVALYNSTNGDDWTASWDLSEPVAEWDGISTSGDRVVDIELPNNNLTGAWPTSYMGQSGALSELLGLDLGNNAMTGEIPYYIQNFSALIDLNLQNNDLSGTIPPSIGSLSNLETLDLSGNQLSGSAPLHLTYLLNLMDISLENNQLGYVPDLSGLEWLHGVSVQNNRLDFYSIEPMVGNITEFYYTPQDSVGEAETKLLRPGDPLSISVGVGGSSNQYLWFLNGGSIRGAYSANYYVAETDEGDLGDYILRINNTVATLCTLYTRPITVEFYTPLQIDSMALVEIYNDVNGINWSDQTNWLTAATISEWYGVTVTEDRVTGLDLSGNNLSGSLPSTISDLTALDTLNLAANQLTGTIPTALNNLTYLRLLRLDNNQFTGAVNIGEQWDMQSLYLNDNQLDDLTSLGSFEVLDTLAVENNLLTFEDIEDFLWVPNFTYDPQDSIGSEQWRSVPEGDTLTLAITVGGYYNLYQWSLDGEDIPQATGSSYFISSASSADSGDYTLRVANSVATACTLYSRPIHVEAGYSFMQLDSLALVDLYNSISNSESKLGWVLANPVTTWSGVTVTEGRVTQLNFYNKGLIGYLPPALGDLTALTQLFAPSNYFSGGLPTTISNLKHLTMLDLSNNWTLTDPLPAELGDLDSLQQLKLAWCEITGPIPSELGNLTLLTTLQLLGNNFSGSIPSELGGLSALTILLLQYNELSGTLPASLGNLTSLGIMDLTYNQLTGDIPAELGSLSALSYMSLAYNQLTSVPTTIGQLESLAHLNLSNNLLSALPSEITALTGLEQITLNDNQLTALPAGFGNLPNLTELNLSNNLFAGTIPAVIDSLAALTRLEMEGNQLTGEIPTWIGDLSNLTHLYLDGNQLSGAVPTAIGNLGNLSDLKLQDNQLEDMPDLSLFQFESFQYLRIYGNRLTFEDIVPNVGVAETRYYYSPQDSVGTEQDTTLIEGSGLTLSVTVGGTGNVYHWTQNGVDLADQDTLTDEFSLPALTPDDAGDYLLRATNPGTPELTIYSYPIHVVVIDTTAPAVPQIISAVAGDSSATLTWHPNTEGDFSRYRIYGGTASNPTTRLDSTMALGDTVKTVSGLQIDSLYYFRLTAADTSGNESEYSEEVSVTPANINPPAPPLNLVAQAGDSSVTLTWHPNGEGDFLRYRIYGGIAPNPTTAWDSTAAIIDTTRTIAGLVNGTPYYFRITAVDVVL
ncbi:leucine-rich repeat domain-containing protein, partial [Candidatus Neomarinimicrobiota bacterium]